MFNLANQQPQAQNLFGNQNIQQNQPQTQNLFQQNQPQQMNQQNQPQQNQLNFQEKQDCENFEQTLRNFIEANTHNDQQQNPLYIFKSPMFNLIPDLKQNPQLAQNYYQFVPNDMNKNIHLELQKNNPDRNRFYLDYLRGWKDMEQRGDQISKFSQQLIERSGQICKNTDDMKVQNQEIFKKRIQDLKQKNHLILDKVLSVYNLIEIIAQRYNNVERKNEEEINLYRNFQDQENEIKEIQQKLFEIQAKQLESQNQENNKFQENLGSQEKENLQIQLELLKHGINTLQKFSDKNLNEFRAFEEIISQKTEIHNLF